ncbi:MAG: bi-domain-containing oxidoreductase [Actinomycetota bacterium]|nr:bi-domain-containing oxidoreductase [Actinomycetota bacterium]
MTQRLRDGRIEVLDVPPPTVSPEGVLVDVRASLLSAGTERTKVQAGRKNLVQKARSRPDQVALVVEKARRDGIKDTVAAVRTRLEDPSSLGYSAAGVVLSTGALVRELAPGDRVACGGGDYAVHAEIDHVPGNLCVPLPEAVTFEQGAFATVGAIAMHGVRQADVSLGERVAVIGLGLVGQLAGMLLRAAGCTVVGIDLDETLLERARSNGALDRLAPRASLEPDRLPPGIGECDAVLITAATSSDDPVELAAALCRDRGRVVVVGVVGLSLSRARYYDKEIDLRLSRSYGPGRYDRTYEERGIDYPIGYVRWTERRNMEAFVELVAAGRLDLAGLISERVPVQQAPSAYDRLASSTTSPLGIVIEYGSTALEPEPEPAPRPPAMPPAANATVGLIGAGSFASRVVIPGLTAAGFRVVSVASASGLSAAGTVERVPAARALRADEVIADPAASLVAIATRHGSHAEYALRALRAGKAVYVEKPPCLTSEELTDLRHARDESGRMLFVGFNRRHAPHVDALRTHVARAGHPVEVLIRVNAPALPSGHWLNDPTEGGGRLLGEGCHFVDLASWIVGAPADRVSCVVRPRAGETLQTAQRFSIVLEYADDSVATIVYTDGGAPGLPKERIEAHAGGRSAILRDFRSLELRDGTKRRRIGSRSQDKGHRRQFVRLREMLSAPASSTALDPLASMSATLTALAAAGDGGSRRVDASREHHVPQRGGYSPVSPHQPEEHAS